MISSENVEGVECHVEGAVEGKRLAAPAMLRVLKAISHVRTCAYQIKSVIKTSNSRARVHTLNTFNTFNNTSKYKGLRC